MSYEKIILISLDTLRSDGICFNKDKLYPQEYEIRVKPDKSKLDELCENGCFFSNAVSVAPYTSASHAAYFSGLWPKNNGLYDQYSSKLKAENIFQKFKKLGYITTFKTDFPFVLGEHLNMTQGVDNYFIEEEESALNILKKNKKVLSFFHFGQIHYPYGFHSLPFGGDDYVEKVNELEKKYNIHTQVNSLEDMANETFRSAEDLALLYRYKTIISFLYKNKLDDDLFNLYLEGINYFHKNKFNCFLETLVNLLENDNYLIVIFADHGEAWNDQTYGHHNSLDEGVLRVPMIFYAKDIESKYIRTRIRTIDLVPTLLETNNAPESDLDGASLVKMIYCNIEEANRDAFASIRVTEMKDIIDNVKKIEAGCGFINENRNAIKYAAAYYEGDHKYFESYNAFLNRSIKLFPSVQNKLYRYDNLREAKEVKNEILSTALSKKLITLNSINHFERKGQTSDILRKYFNMQGYNV